MVGKCVPRFACFSARCGSQLLQAQTTAEGIAAVEAGRLDEAVRILSAIVHTDPNSSEAHFYLGWRISAPADPPRPVLPLERAAALAPANAQAWKLLGLASTSAGDPESAAAALRKACDLAPQDEESVLLPRTQSACARPLRGGARAIRKGSACGAGRRCGPGFIEPLR